MNRICPVAVAGAIVPYPGGRGEREGEGVGGRRVEEERGSGGKESEGVGGGGGKEREGGKEE